MSPASRAAADAVDHLLRRAASFRSRHATRDGVSSTYGYFTHHPVAPLNRKRLALLLEAIQARSTELRRPLRVVDLACGGGLITCAIASLGHSTLGLDLRADEIALARLFASEEGSEEEMPGRFEQADLLDDPNWEAAAEAALGGRPDVIVLAYALHHLRSVEAFVARLAKWLPAEACLLVNEENPESPVFRVKHVVRTWIQHDTDVEWHRTYAQWKDLLDAHGFSVAPPRGADLVPGVATLLPAKCWSLVFTARRLL